MFENQGTCDHIWVSNTGLGGDPVFKRNRQMSYIPHMHVTCKKCSARTWLTEDSWRENEILDKTSTKTI